MIASRKEIRGAEIARHYDALDPVYRAIWGDPVHHGLWRTGRETLAEARNQLQELVVGELAIQPGQRVCDIGCGYGATARLMATARNAEVTGITISPAQHEAAVRQSAGDANPQFVLGDWLANDFPDGSFDAAVAFESSEHMPDKAAFFAQAARVLRPGGRLVVSGWLIRENPTAFQRRWLLEPICEGSRMPVLGAESDYRSLAAGVSLTVERFQDITREIARTWPMVVRTALTHVATHPKTLGLIIHSRASQLTYTATIIRLWVAFRSGALRYGVFTLVKAGA